MTETNYEVLDVLTDKEIVTEYLNMNGVSRFNLTEKDMELLYTLSKYGILYSEDALEILGDSKNGKRRSRLKALGILDGKRGLVYLSMVSRKALFELDIESHAVHESDKIMGNKFNRLAERYRKEVKTSAKK